MLKEIIAEYFKIPALITFVLGIIGSLLSLRYGNTITGYLKTTRVWWRAVAGLITVVISLILWNCQMHWPATELECYKNKYEQFYKPQAERHISEMEKIISPNYFNKSLHFYVLYLSHYNLLSGNTDKGTYYFHLFESYRIDTSYFKADVQ